MKNKTSISIHLTIVSLAVMPYVCAANPVEELGETTVTASRTEQPLFETPASVSVLDDRDILQRALRTVPEALRYNAGVLIQKTTHGHGSPYIRGFTGRQNLLLVDGVRVNNSTYRSGPIQYWNTLDGNAVGRLELVRGPNSVLYGSDALGGTLNVLSKGTGFEDEVGKFYRGSLYYRFETNSSSHVARLEQRFGVGRKWGALIGITAKDFGDIRDSNLGVMKHTGYGEEGVDFKFEYMLNDATRLTLAHQYVNQDDIWRWHSTKFNRGWIHGAHVATAGSLNYRIYDQERSLSYLKLESDSDVKLLERWQTTFSYQHSQDSEKRDGRFADAGVDTYGFAFQANSELEHGDLVWGLDYYHDEVDSTASSARRRPVADDSSYDTVGVFAQYDWHATEALTVSGGLRGSYFHARWGKVFNRTIGLDESGSGNWSNLSANLRASYAVSDATRVYGAISQGFRAPNLDDLTGSQVANSSDEVVGSSSVNPEKVVNLELGVKHDDGDVSLTAAAFYTFITDPITRVKDTTVIPNLLRITNGEDGYIYGVEIEGVWYFADHWKLSSNLSWQDGKQKAQSTVGGPITEDTIRRLAPLSGSVSLKWTHPNERFWVEGSILGAATQNNLSAKAAGDRQRIPSGGTPGYLIASLRGGYELTENVTLTLALENLTDEDYRVHASGVNETGFNALMGVKVTW